MTQTTAPPIPKLPGYTVCMPQSLSDKGFKKGQTLTYLNGYQRGSAMPMVNDVPVSTAQLLGMGLGSSTKDMPAYSSTLPSVDSPGSLPQWVSNDRKVLRFFGYFQESVNESNMENHRIRKVILYYYLEDDSMHVAEPRQDNSGIPQGVLIKRHKLTRTDQSFYCPSDFTVGEPLTIYGRTFYLVDADVFTREYYATNLGRVHGPALPYPDDPVEAYRASFGLVLRFWAVWDDRDSMYGDRRPYVLHYYLEDDSVEILDVNENNSGRDPFPIFLKRAPLPKVAVRANTTLSTRYRKDQCYSPEDLRIGAYVSVHNRDFLLHDCDNFTKAWCRDNLGSSDAELSPIDITELFEPPARNSGIAGGKFLERQKIYKAQSEEIYTYLDLYVGGQLEIHNRTFEMTEGDEYTHTYMENNKHIFIMADTDILVKSLRAQVQGKSEAVRSAFIEMDKSGSGSMSGEELEGALYKAGMKFTRHQAVVLRRRMAKDNTGGVLIEEFLGTLGISY
ncbi:MAG: hypothetical protein WDW38_002460 [Sanguina aurantia]